MYVCILCDPWYTHTYDIPTKLLIMNYKGLYIKNPSVHVNYHLLYMKSSLYTNDLDTVVYIYIKNYIFTD